MQFIEYIYMCVRSGGNCTAPDVCTCINDWEGEVCEIALCQGNTTCERIIHSIFCFFVLFCFVLFFLFCFFFNVFRSLISHKRVDRW